MPDREAWTRRHRGIKCDRWRDAITYPCVNMYRRAVTFSPGRLSSLKGGASTI